MPVLDPLLEWRLANTDNDKGLLDDDFDNMFDFISPDELGELGL